MVTLTKPVVNGTDTRLDAIQHMPRHRCPICGAAGISAPNGSWYSPWVALGSGPCALDAWSDHIGYVRFACGRNCHPPGSLRVARLGDAILPVDFVSRTEAAAIDLPADQTNAKRVRAAVAYLAAHTGPEHYSEDPLVHVVYALAAGSIGPEKALRRIRGLRFEQA